MKADFNYNWAAYVRQLTKTKRFLTISMNPSVAWLHSGLLNCDMKTLEKTPVGFVGAGYEVLGKLEAGDAEGATQIYAGTTVVALNEARADAYTMMSELERPISLAGFRCK